MKQITDEELRAIRERAEKAAEGNPLVDIDALIRKEEVINEDIPKLLAEIERLRDKQIKKEITETIPGGGKCPSCDVRLIGKANYCGKCGQRIGWQVYGGNIYDNNGGDDE